MTLSNDVTLWYHVSADHMNLINLTHIFRCNKRKNNVLRIILLERKNKLTGNKLSALQNIDNWMNFSHLKFKCDPGPDITAFLSFTDIC